MPLGSISVYTLLDKGQVTGGDGFSTDPQQSSSKYTELVDDKHIFGFQNVAPVVSQKLLNGQTGKRDRADRPTQVSAMLTLSAMQRDEQGRLRADKRSRAQIASKFLKANGLK